MANGTVAFAMTGEVTEKMATQLAAGLWCEPKHSSKVMDPDFCQSIIQLIMKVGNNPTAYMEAADAKRD